MDYYDNAQDRASQVAIRLEGLSYLLQNFKAEGIGDRDDEAHVGIGLLLEDLAKEARDVGRMLDCATRPKPISKA